jgi:hypothetical protein
MAAVPKREQLRRTKDWRLPEGAITVARPTRWGNPFRVGIDGDREQCVERYREALYGGKLSFGLTEVQSKLRGHDLACWCPLQDDQGQHVPCHADVLLEAATCQPGESEQRD